MTAISQNETHTQIIPSSFARRTSSSAICHFGR